jgi:hypothetical protein
LPIGNLTSQFLANVYLDTLDHAVKEERRVRGYIRYMDDMIFFGEDRAALLELRVWLDEWLQTRLGLQLKSPATWLNRSSHGLSFLGMRIFPRLIRVRPENRRRSLRRLRRVWSEYGAGRIGEDALAQSAASIAGHLRHFCPRAPVPLGAEAGKAAAPTG